MKTAIVEDVRSIRKWEGPNGTVFYHEIVLDNGDFGSIGKKTEDSIHIGDELTYTIELHDRGNRIKAVNPQFVGGNGGSNGGGFKGTSKGSSASFALSYAKDLAVANIAKASGPIEMEQLTERVIAAAEKFNEWLEAH
jgi:hypothetical protein